MIRLLGIPLLFGILVFLSIIFILPGFYSESEMVAGVAEFILDQTNSYFETMPSLVAQYITSLNLFVIAVSAGLVVTILVQLLVITVSTLATIIRMLLLLLRREKKVEPVKDLPSVELDFNSTYKTRSDKVLGKGFDSVDPK